MNISSIGTNIADWFRGIPERGKELQDRVKLYFAARKAARSPKINDQQNQASQVVTNQNTNAARSNEANFHETKNNTNTTDASPLASIDQWNAQVKNEKVNIQTQFSSTSTVGTAVKNFIDSQAFLKFDDDNDTVRKDFARGVLRGVLGGVHETAWGETVYRGKLVNISKTSSRRQNYGNAAEVQTLPPMPLTDTQL